MAVSSTFIRGIQSSFTSNLLRSSSSNGGIASSSRHVLGSNSCNLFLSGGCNDNFGIASFSTSSTTKRSKEKEFEKVSIPLEKVEKFDDPSHIGHSTVGGKVGRHSKRTLASFSMENKVCVVTGAARGLGNLMARTLIESGANQVAFLDLNEQDATKAAQEAAKWFIEHGKADQDELDMIGIGCDVANEQSVKEAFDRIHQRWGRINTVVNSAGIVENFPAEQYPTEKYQKLMNINVNGSWFVANEAARRMIADKTENPSIVLVASMSGTAVNVPQVQAPYNLSKAAVKHMASSLGVEWAKYGIRVNSLSPGYMMGPLVEAVFKASEEGKFLKNEWERRTPLGRLGQPEDLKGAIIFLASDASRYVTSFDLLVDGGYTAV